MKCKCFKTIKSGLPLLSATVHDRHGKILSNWIEPSLMVSDLIELNRRINRIAQQMSKCSTGEIGFFVPQKS